LTSIGKYVTLRSTHFFFKEGETVKKQRLCSWMYVALMACCISFIASGSASGAGFALIEQSVSGLGNAYAGGAASAEDASTIFYNPAGMVLLGKNQLIFGAHVVMPTVEFHNEGSTHVLQGATGIPLSGDNGGDGGVTKVIPNFYYSRKISDRFAVGLGINAPFGLATEYDDYWVGRYHAIESDLLSVNINPSIAYRITNYLSFGVGVSAQYLKAKLTNAIDFGTLDAVGALGLPPHALGLVPQLADGFAEIEGDSWGFGYNAGLMLELGKNTRIGAAYRSRIEHTLKGDADFSHVPAGLHAYPVFKDTDAEADITVPDSFSLSAFHQFNPHWMVMADFTWTNWQLFDKLAVDFDNPYQPNSTTTENWQDSYRASLGVTFVPDNNWIFRAGTAYDTSAVADKEHRTPRIPDGDRIWAALGLGYRVSKVVSFDAGYAHLFINDPQIDQDPTGENAIRGGLKGTFDADIDIISAQLNITF
jgi:long-chain fatty acid transport protein